MDENRSPAFAPDLQDGDVQGMGVLTGNFPAEYGRKLGGVIEVTTARDIERGFHGDGRRRRRQLRHGIGWRDRPLRVGAARVVAECVGRERPIAILIRRRRTTSPTTARLRGITAAYDEQLNTANRLRFTWHHRTTDFLVPNERVQELGRAAAGTHRHRGPRAGHVDVARRIAVRLQRARNGRADWCNPRLEPPPRRRSSSRRIAALLAVSRTRAWRPTSAGIR